MQTCDDVSNSMSVYEERVIIHVCLESLVEPRLFLSPNIIISVIAFLVFVSIIYPLIYLSWNPEAHFNQYYPSQNPSSRNTSAVFPFLPHFALRHYNLVQYFFQPCKQRRILKMPRGWRNSCLKCVLSSHQLQKGCPSSHE